MTLHSHLSSRCPLFYPLGSLVLWMGRLCNGWKWDWIGGERGGGGNQSPFTLKFSHCLSHLYNHHCCWHPISLCSFLHVYFNLHGLGKVAKEEAPLPFFLLVSSRDSQPRSLHYKVKKKCLFFILRREERNGIEPSDQVQMFDRWICGYDLI